jgi:hypothetical protein
MFFQTVQGIDERKKTNNNKAGRDKNSRPVEKRKKGSKLWRKKACEDQILKILTVLKATRNSTFIRMKFSRFPSCREKQSIPRNVRILSNMTGKGTLPSSKKEVLSSTSLSSILFISAC